ncbi:modifier of mdg4-like isoform X1 [Drosophila eugracilis]|uniref:modifier of mdg4-like isoform X1 n=1 Tax=Drosophila eugracilis TaxID=29029 RepID=UPI0007E6A3B7|nr:modifier of mdg4-like isoform X1 [Drosophila eugracilis]
MADDEQFSLCWNNFNTNLSAGFHESLCRGDLVDVSLAAEGQIVKAHRLVLSVCSPFFRKMFTQMPSNSHAIVFLNNVSHSALKDLIQFMYCGEVNVKQDALPAFISTAESLQIKGLTDNDPAPQPPQEPSPPPAAPHVQQQQLSAQRVQRQQPRASARYKIETVDDGLGDDNKGTTQIVIQTTAAPQATIVQQPQQQQATQQIQTQQQLQAGTTTTATLVSTNKRSAQRSSLTSGSSSNSGVKRSKTSTSTNVIDPLDSATETGTTTTTQLVPQQITVQTAVVTATETKLHQQTQQVRQQQQEEAEYIELPMELPTKSEPDYSEDHGDAAGDGEGTYVEDDAYGDMRYDESYFTENEDAGNQTTANTSGGGVTATTSKAVSKQASQNYSDSSFVDTSADQGNTEAQVKIKMEPSPTPALPTDAAVASLAVTYLSDDESFRKPFTLPKILDGKFYKNIQPNQKTPGAIQATCTTCYGLISGTTKSTGNFLSHIKRRHKELLPLCQLYCQAKTNGSVSAIKTETPNLNSMVTSTTPTPTVEMMSPVSQMPAPSYATAPTHLAMPVSVPVPVSMSLAMPLSLPHVQTPQMMALMQQHQAHGAVFISKDY